MKTIRINTCAVWIIFFAFFCVFAHPTFAATTVTVTSPNGGENWTPGSTHSVTWTISGTTTSINYQLVALSTDGGVTYNNIGSTQTPSSRSMSWTIPAGTSSTQVRIRVRALDISANILGQDTSDANFTISNPSQPNLAPYQNSGWSDKIVVARTANSTTDSTALTTADTLYVNAVVINNGAAATSANFNNEVYVDGVATFNWVTAAPLNVNFISFLTSGFSIGQLSAGTHTIKITADYGGVIAESNEGDNSYTKTITVNNPAQPNLAPYQNSGWSDKIVVARTASSTTDSTALTTADTLYVNAVVINNGAAATAVNFNNELYVDGVPTYNWVTIAPLNVNFISFLTTGYPIGQLSAGAHTIKITADYGGVIAESNEGDNSYTKTITVASLNVPTVQTLPATSIGSSTATLNAQITDNGGATILEERFSWGTTAACADGYTSAVTANGNNFSYNLAEIPPGTYYYQAWARNSVGWGHSTAASFNTVSAPTLSITTTAFNPATATVGTGYAAQQAVAATGGQTPYSWSASGLPSGMAINSSSGAPYGTPTVTGTFNVAVTVTDSSSPQKTASKVLSLTVMAMGAPAVQTLTATAVTTSSAQLNGSINPNGLATTVYYKYGLTLNYGSTTASGNFGTTPQNVGFVQTGLLPNTIYHYCIIASNSQGISQGLDATFTTLPTSTTAQQAWVAGTSGLGLRLRSSPSLSASILLVMPEGSTVTLLSDTQTAGGYLWRHVTYASQTGWADAQYLVFSQGTPTPPAVPITLRQLQADGFTLIASGGSATSSSVVLAATPSGSSVQQFSVQFEVRPAGTSFSNPTATTAPVQGGSEIRATVSALANQNYHWRARVLDGNGVPSDWVSFSANTTDFAVNAATSPLASFSWSPAQVFTGNSITFTAQAASQSGLTFSWNFGGTQTATGGTVSQTFSQSGDVVVTLTVTDSQNNQSQKSQTVSVASTDLVSRINATAGQSEAMLDDILANATLASGAADYFKEGVDNAPLDIGVQAALTGLSLIMGSTDNELDLASRCEDWARQEYGNAAANDLAVQFAPHFLANESIDHFRDAFVSWAVSKVANGSSQSYQQMWMPGLTTYVAAKKAEIEQKRQQAVTAAGSLNPTQSALLLQNLQSRLLGNYALEASYDANANLPISFQSYKSSDESGWTTYNIGQHLFSTSVSLLGTALGGMGGIVAGVAATSSQAELDIFNTLATQSAEAQLMSLSLNVAGQGQTLVSQISTNIETGLNAIINSQSPTTSMGTINSISAYSQGTYFSTVDLMARWFATTAYSDVVVKNTGTQAATYRLEAFLTKTFVTGQLPVNFLGLGQRKYDFQVAVAQDGISLNSGGQTTIRLNFMNGDGGAIPEGQDIIYVLTARMSDGYYRQDSQIQHFGTTYLDQNGNPVDPALVAAATISQQPLQSSLLMFPGTNICELKITVQNPLETPVMLNLGQNLPSGAVVINAAGGAYSNNSLSWQLNMQPGELQYFQVVLQLPLPVSNPPVTSTTASAYDSVNDTWVQFTNAPVVSQMISSPPPQIQPAGFTGGSFGLNVQAPIPGIYRVDATSDFINWNPVLTVTNDAGSFQIMDTDAQNHSARFYRTSRR